MNVLFSHFFYFYLSKKVNTKTRSIQSKICKKVDSIWSVLISWNETADVILKIISVFILQISKVSKKYSIN